MKNKILMVSGIIFLVLGIQCTSPKTMEENTQKQQVRQISIKEQIAKGGFLVDVRTREEFDAGSIKGAVNIPLYDIENRLNEFKFRRVD
jgi:3-mercaptopyruvate sulfurtransferase SseA